MLEKKAYPKFEFYWEFEARDNTRIQPPVRIYPHKPPNYWY